MTEYIAFEIKTLNDYELANAIWPNLKAELAFENVKNNFLVLNYEGGAHALVNPAVDKDFILTNFAQVRLLTFVRK